MALGPKPLVVARFFAAEQAALDELEAELASVSASLDELAEEHGAHRASEQRAPVVGGVREHASKPRVGGLWVAA